MKTIKEREPLTCKLEVQVDRNPLKDQKHCHFQVKGGKVVGE